MNKVLGKLEKISKNYNKSPRLNIYILHKHVLLKLKYNALYKKASSLFVTETFPPATIYISHLISTIQLLQKRKSKIE